MMYSKENFFLCTKAVFKGCKVPRRKPDYISLDREGNVSSLYWYTDKGVYRQSNHWSYIQRLWIENMVIKTQEALIECGKVASCFWSLRMASETDCGFCAWKKFKKNHKGYLVYP